MNHETHVSLEAQLSEAKTTQDSRKQTQIQEQLEAAQEKMHAEVQRFETERKRLTERIRQAWQQSNAVRESHQRRTLLEDKAYSLAALGPSSELTDVLLQLREAHKTELAELERYENEEQDRREAAKKEYERRVAEICAQQEAERKELEQREAELRARIEAAQAERAQCEAKLRQGRNRFHIPLSALIQHERLTFPVETASSEMVGRVTVRRHWWYVKQNRSDLICTLHIHFQLQSGESSELLVVAASNKLEYQPAGVYEQLSPARRGPVRISAGEWQVVVRATNLKINHSPPLEPPHPPRGTSPAFTALELDITASKMTPKEIQRARKARRLAEKRRSAQQGNLAALIGYYFPWWVLPAIVLAYLALILLIIFICCLASYLPKLLDAIG